MFTSFSITLYSNMEIIKKTELVKNTEYFDHSEIIITIYGKIVILHIYIRGIKKSGYGIDQTLSTSVPIPVNDTLWFDLNLPQEDGFQFIIKNNKLIIDLIDKSFVGRTNDANIFFTYISK